MMEDNGIDISRRRLLGAGGTAAAISLVDMVFPKLRADASSGNDTQIGGSLPDVLLTDPITDPTKQAVYSHVGDNFVEISTAPQSRDVIERFELYFDLKSTSYKNTRGAFVLAFNGNSRSEIEEKSGIEFVVTEGTLAGIYLINPSADNEVDEIILSDEDFDSAGDPNIGLVKVSGTRNADGYEIEITWEETIYYHHTHDDPVESATRSRSHTLQMSIEDIYYFSAIVTDQRNNSAGSLSSLTSFPAHMNHLNDVLSSFALTSISTSQEAEDFVPIDVVIQRSGRIGAVWRNPSQPPGEVFSYLLVEPRASNYGVVKGIVVEPWAPDTNYLVIKDSSGERISQTPEGERVPLYKAGDTFTADAPFSVVTTLGDFEVAKAFLLPIARIGRDEITWVAPSINSMSKCSDIIYALRQTVAREDDFRFDDGAGNLVVITPGLFAFGCAEITDLTIELFQRDSEGNLLADAVIQGDDLYKGKIKIPESFDLSKPIECNVGGHTKTLGFVREPYPVITPEPIILPVPSPSICVPPPYDPR